MYLHCLTLYLNIIRTLYGHRGFCSIEGPQDFLYTDHLHFLNIHNGAYKYYLNAS